MMRFFKRGDFSYKNPAAIKLWIQINIGKVTPKKVDLIKNTLRNY